MAAPVVAALVAALFHGVQSLQFLEATKSNTRTVEESELGEPPLWSLVDLHPRRKAKSLMQARNGSNGVDVFIGSGGHGHTYPGATTPWGMVQATPWTHKDGVDPWDTQSGYSALAPNPDFYGMAHSALSGAGSGEMGEFRLLPLFPGMEKRMVLLSRSADASPGYFAADVRPHNTSRSGPSVHIQSTATPRGAIHKFKFPRGGGARLVQIVLSEVPNNFWGWELIDNRTKVVSDRRFEGCTLGDISGMGSALAHLCFVVEFDQPFNSTSKERWFPEAVNFMFPAEGSRTITARLAVSRTDVAHARSAFDSEVSGKSLQQALKEARAMWEKALGTVRVKVKSRERKRILYTALYHSMLAPNLLSDSDGSYRLQKASPGTFPRRGTPVHFDDLETQLPLRKTKDNASIYHTFSSWDTYRSLHPLMNLLQPEVSRHFGESLMAFYDAWGYIPAWQLVHSPTDMMEGDGGSIILATMALNGLVDKNRSLEVLKTGRMQPVADQRRCLGSPECFQEKISELLEQAKADRCVARLADRLGRSRLAEQFANRSQLAFKLWDKSQGVFAPLLGSGPADGHMTVDVDAASPLYMEGSPLQYSWSAEFDLPKMVELRNGEEGLACALDNFVYHSKKQTGPVDMSGSFGAISLGNEPSMHIPYLYSLVGYPERTQELVGHLMDGLFTDKADGLPGNDDLGQMSSWAIFTMLGFYPVDPCSGEYALGRPFVEEAELTLHDGGKLKIKAHDQSDKNVYVKQLRWNGKDLDIARPKLSFDMIAGGGLLEFWMSNKPALGQRLVCRRKEGQQQQDQQQQQSSVR